MDGRGVGAGRGERKRREACRIRPQRMAALLLVEDDVPFATAVGQVLRRARADWSLEHAATLADARERVAARAFDLVIVDLDLPDGPGTRLVSELSRLTPPLRAAVFTIFDDRDHVLGAVRAGAVGYLLKEEPPARLVGQIAECLDGQQPLSSRITAHLFGLCRTHESDVQLTPRERDVLEQLRAGATYAECALALEVGVGTVQTHVKSLYRKLDVSSKTEAAAWAARFLGPS